MDKGNRSKCMFIYLKEEKFYQQKYSLYPCIIEMDNTHGKHEITIVNNERVVGHIPIRLSKFVHMFLSLSGSHLEAEVKGG